MPCFYTGSREGDERLLVEEELNRLTRLLCKTAKKLKRAGVITSGKRPDGVLSEFPELKAWAEAHWERERKKKPKKRASSKTSDLPRHMRLSK